MTNNEIIDKIRAEIERLKANAVNHGKCYCEYERGYMQGKKDSYEHFLSFLSTLDSEKAIPKDVEETKNTEAQDCLEDAANEYAEKHGFRVPYDGSNNFYDDVDVKASKDGFIAGAKWQKQHDDELIEIAYNDGITIGMTKQKEQMMKEAVEGEVFFNPYPTICLDDCKDYDFKDGDKVRVIIIKKED